MIASGRPIAVLFVAGRPPGAEPDPAFDADALNVDVERDPVRAAETVAEGTIDCVVSAADLAECDGLALLEAVGERAPEVARILAPETGSEALAARAIRGGIDDYVPREDPDAPSLEDRILAVVDSPSRQPESGAADLDGRAVDSPAPSSASSSSSAPTSSTDSQFEAVFEDPKMLVALLDAEGHVERVNETATSYVPHDREALVGEPFWETPWWSVSESLQADVREWVQRAAEGEYVEYEADHASTDDAFTVSGTIRPVTTESGEVTGLVASARDITERRERERELDQFRALTQHSSDILTVLDRDGTINYESPSIERVLGYEQDELVGETAYDYVHPEDRERVAEAFTSLYTNPETTTDRLTYRMRDADGEWRWLESTGSNRADTAVDGYVVTSRDVTERKCYEQQLEETNDRLEAFTRIVSHDLRNPLNVLAGSIELADETGEIGHLDHCREAVDRMDELLEDLLALAKAGESVADREPVALDAVATDCWDAVETGDATLAVETDESIVADRSRLRQCFENFFRNSIEHGTPSPDPNAAADADLTVTVGPLADGFYVADDGPGIDADDPERLLESGTSSSEDGTGLGLWIVADVVEAHGWEISIEASDAGGARFEITGVDSLE